MTVAEQIVLDAIPQELMVRMAEFLEAKKTGKISLNISEGAILSADLNDHWVNKAKNIAVTP